MTPRDYFPDVEDDQLVELAASLLEDLHATALYVRSLEKTVRAAAGAAPLQPPSDLRSLFRSPAWRAPGEA